MKDLKLRPDFSLCYTVLAGGCNSFVLRRWNGREDFTYECTNGIFMQC